MLVSTIKKGELSTMAFSLKRLLWNQEAVDKVNADYKARMQAIDDKAAAQKADRIAARAALKEATQEAFRENNARLKEAWRNA